MLLLGLAALVLMLVLAGGFSRAKVANIKALLAWVVLLGGAAFLGLELVAGRIGPALASLVFLGPAAWELYRIANGKPAKPTARPKARPRQAGPRQAGPRQAGPRQAGPRQAGPNPQAAPPRSQGGMSAEEAWQVLGLAPGASEEAIRAAHLRLMRAVHPDTGGSDWMAARVNMARDLLLRR